MQGRIINIFVHPPSSPYRDMIFGMELDVFSNSLVVRANNSNFEKLKMAFLDVGMNVDSIRFHHQDSPFQFMGLKD